MLNTPTIPEFSPELPVLIAGPTASGKSALALAIAANQGRRVVNADALQVFDGWHLLTARPSAQDCVVAPHVLYGHVPFSSTYSVGQWLREVTPFLTEHPAPVIVGGTGLYFMALTEGLARIPATRPDIRLVAMDRHQRDGLAALIADLDPHTRAKLDLRNPARVLRAWEVQTQTGRGLADWHLETGAPALPPEAAHRIHLTAGKDWLNARIDRRFDAMMAAGALDEARRMEPFWDPAHLSARAIGAAEMIAVIRGKLSVPEAVTAAKIASHQYAKRQRTWFRRRMGQWQGLNAETLTLPTGPT